MKLIRWELSFGVYPGFLLGYRQYVDNDNLKIDHVLYLLLFDVCLSLYYE